MNRRDTIIIAVLINMGLLISLFVTAIRPSSAERSIADAPSSSIASETKVGVNEEKASIDQVDSILHKYLDVEEKKETPVIETTSESVKEEKGAFKEVIVRSGDVLGSIALKNQTTVDEIMRVNKLTDTRLQIGQILYIPVGKEEGIVIKEEKTVKEVTGPKYYVVKNGDNPWTIAIKNGIKVDELLKLNGLDEAKAKKLKPGDKLRIK